MPSTSFESRRERNCPNDAGDSSGFCELISPASKAWCISTGLVISGFAGVYDLAAAEIGGGNPTRSRCSGSVDAAGRGL